MPLAIIVLTMLTVRASLADHVRVPTGSMQPTVAIGDRVIVNKAAYGLRVPGTQLWLARFAGPAVGDVVVLDAPDEDKLLLKRVVAGPGDTIMKAAPEQIAEHRRAHHQHRRPRLREPERARPPGPPGQERWPRLWPRDAARRALPGHG